MFQKIASFVSSKVSAACVAVAAAAVALLMETPAFAVPPALEPSTLTGIDLSTYATTIGTVLGGLLATIIVVALAFVVIKKGFRALSGWIKA